MTILLALLCLAIAGRELYLAFERRRTPGAREINAVARAQRHDREALAAADGRIRSLITQINDRVLPDVNDRLARGRADADRQRAELDRLSGEVAVLRAGLARRLDAAVAASLGAPPADLVAGSASAEPAPAQTALTSAYERFTADRGLHVELADGSRYHLSGHSPRALESDFIDLVQTLRGDCAEPVAALLDALRAADQGAAAVGPLLAVRTPEALVCGVLPLAELLNAETARLLDDPSAAADRLRLLPEGRYCELPVQPAPDGQQPNVQEPNAQEPNVQTPDAQDSGDTQALNTQELNGHGVSDG